MLQEGFRLSKLQPTRIRVVKQDIDYLVQQMSVVLEGDLATLQINFESIYRKCQLVCITNRQDLLDQVVMGLEKYITTSLNQIQFDYVSKVNSLFQEFQEKVYLISNLFLYLKEDFVKISWKKFKEILLRNEPLSKRLSSNIIQEIEKHRNNEVVDLVLIRSIIKIFIQLEIYFQIFDTKFLQESKEYYSKEAELKLGSLNPVEYINHVEARLQLESLSTIQNEFGYLDQATKRPLLVIIEQSFIHKYASKIIEFFNQFADQKQYLDIARLYKLFSKTSDLGLFKLQISKYILESCDKVLTTCADTEMIETLLNFQTHISEIIRVGCLDNVEMMNQSKESFAVCINKRQNKPAELIALYIDKLLKKSKGLNENEIDVKLDQLVFLFRLIQGKDVFEAFYGKSLAKRLLLEKSASVDLEKSMLIKLQCECGPGFTQKLEGMFKDIDLSKEIMSGFQEAHKFQSRIQDFEFNVNTLTASYWPSYSINELVLPEKFIQYQKVFEEFYVSKYNGRRLTWPMSLGYCLLQYHCEGGNKDLVLSLYQTIVLLLFNDNQSLTTQEIKNHILLDELDLFRTLQSLSLGKVKLLKKIPYVKEVKYDDKWSINEKFTHPQRRIVVNQIQATETVQELETTKEKVFEDRLLQVDACIVRIMKSEKVCGYKKLVNLLFEELKFPMEMVDLKKRIESLIERDYIERDSKDNNVYNYLA